MKYDSYSPELPPPSPFDNLSVCSPLLRPLLLAHAAAARRQVRSVGLFSFSMGDMECLTAGPDTDEILPAILYLHGGGFVFPLQPKAARLGRYYANALRCRVFLPDYRCAPEHPFPTPLEDCFRAYRYLCGNGEILGIDPHRIVLLGESSGGTLAAALCQKLRDEALQLPAPAAQMLLYPATDWAMDSDSMKRYRHAAWPAAANRRAWSLYLKNGMQGQLPYAAPLRATRFDALPPAYVEVCSVDTLRDQGVAYAQQLKQAEVPVELHEIQGAYHGYDTHLDSPLVQRSLHKRVEFLENIFQDALA